MKSLAKDILEFVIMVVVCAVMFWCGYTVGRKDCISHHVTLEDCVSVAIKYAAK